MEHRNNNVQAVGRVFGDDRVVHGSNATLAHEHVQEGLVYMVGFPYLFCFVSLNMRFSKKKSKK
jgi:hypothetical protein